MLSEASFINSGAVLMAVKHRTKPFYGLQFHPESICSDERSRQLVVNWWSEARQWNKQRRLTGSSCRGANTRLQSPKDKGHFDSAAASPKFELPVPHNTAVNGHDPEGRTPHGLHVAPKKPLKVISRVMPLGALTVNDICDLLDIRSGHGVVFDSEPYQRPEIGRFSIIGKTFDASLRFEYSVGSDSIEVFCGAASVREPIKVDLANCGNDIFCFLKAFMKKRKAAGGDPSIPFWGGLVGNISYEACLETVDIQTPKDDGKPDVNFLYIERSLVIDHELQKVHIQSIVPDDDKWVDRISSEVAKLRDSCPDGRLYGAQPYQADGIVSSIDPVEYGSKIRKCQEHIRKGNSYELCLITQITIKTKPAAEDAWPMYQRLRALNPAPFSTYLRTSKLTLLSSSPERFMSWTRPGTYATTLKGETRSIVQVRPIKGTVKRYPYGPNGPEVSLQDATRLLSTPKERAENLMIVDLIRHDLHGVVGSGNVCVPKLMVVEQYATLYQLVTVVEGTLINQHLDWSLTSDSPAISKDATSHSDTPRSSASSPLSTEEETHESRFLSTSQAPKKTGIDVLAASLPPGSMTGAPKRRSCALLRQIENEQPRGVYSGVVGYMD
ncbi:MAG: hypothetical protein Q9183_005783, partial [Haloplaca sp. 2 TL-2023]